MKKVGFYVLIMIMAFITLGTQISLGAWCQPCGANCKCRTYKCNNSACGVCIAPDGKSGSCWVVNNCSEKCGGDPHQCTGAGSKCVQKCNCTKCITPCRGCPEGTKTCNSAYPTGCGWHFCGGPAAPHTCSIRCKNYPIECKQATGCCGGCFYTQANYGSACGCDTSGNDYTIGGCDQICTCSGGLPNCVPGPGSNLNNPCLCGDAHCNGHCHGCAWCTCTSGTNCTCTIACSKCSGRACYWCSRAVGPNVGCANNQADCCNKVTPTPTPTPTPPGP